MEMAASPQPRRRTEKGFPLFRTIIIIGIVGAVLVGAGALSFFADQASRQVPLQIELYPGAADWVQLRNCPALQCTLYRVPGVTPELVADHYQTLLNEHNGNDSERCVRIPETGAFPANELAEGQVPYLYKCLFDRSGFGNTQFTEVIVMPGLYNVDPAFNTEGMTVIQYNQSWQP
jgi:hypothetical protein